MFRFLVFCFIFAWLIALSQVAWGDEFDTTNRPGDPIGVNVLCNDSEFVQAVAERNSSALLFIGIQNKICAQFPNGEGAFLIKWISGPYMIGEGKQSPYSIWQAGVPSLKIKGYLLMNDEGGLHEAADPS